MRRVVGIGRQRETAGDGGSLLLRVYGASRHEQETLGATGSNTTQQEVAAVHSPTTNLRPVVEVADHIRCILGSLFPRPGVGEVC